MTGLDGELTFNICEYFLMLLYFMEQGMCGPLFWIKFLNKFFTVLSPSPQGSFSLTPRINKYKDQTDVMVLNHGI
jgi:hypothetical protein